MSTRIQLSTKRKSTPNHYEIQESPRIEEGDYPTTSHEDEEEGTQTRSRDTQGRSATSASTILAQVMMANQKNSPPPAAAAATASTRSVTTTASLGTSSRARAVQSPATSSGCQHYYQSGKPKCAHPKLCLTPCCCPNASCISTGHAATPPNSRCWSEAVSYCSFCCCYPSPRRFFG